MLLVRPLMHFYLSLFRCLGGLALLFFLLPSGARASHMFGADLFYTHVSNHTYTITMVVYADCDLNNNAFNALPYVSPEVVIYRGNTVFQGINLSPVPPTAGTEVTPVCPSQLNNTSCRSASGTVPGIRQYTYSKTVNLGSTHANWRFQFTGFLGANTSAGRSNSLTNIIISTVGSLMGLEATLNNTAGPNSSPRYTTIPTPFFCINKVASYNPGAVDPNG